MGRQRLGNLGAKLEGFDESRGGVFFWFSVRKTRQYLSTFRQPIDFHQIWPRHVNPCALEKYQKEFPKMARLCVICPQK